MVVITLAALVGWVVILDIAGLLVRREFADLFSDEPSDAEKDEE